MTPPAEEFQPSLDKAIRVLSGLSVAAKTYRLYPNPLEQSAFGRAMSLIREGLGDQSFIRMHVLPDHFSIEGQEFGLDNEAVSELASWLFRRGVTELHVRGEPVPSELVAFAELVSSEEKDVEAQGGAKVFLAHRDATAIQVVDRKLAVGAFTPMALQTIPDRLRSLLENQLGLAQEISNASSPQEAYERLRQLLKTGREVGLEENSLNAGIADVVALIEPGYRAEVLEIAINSLPEEFAALIVSQLSDGEITESLLALTSKRPIDLILGMAHDVVEHSGGRRAELPIIVGKRMLELGFDYQRVNEAHGTKSKHGDMLVQWMPADSLRLNDAEGDLGLDELKSEARSLAAEANELAGISTLQGVLRSSDYEQDFKETLDLVVDAIERAISEGNRDRYSRLIELLATELSTNAAETRQLRIEETLSRVASTQLVADLLKQPAADTDELTNRIFAYVGGRVVPALTTMLADEVDRGRRKVLLEMLTATAPKNPTPVIEGLADPRWYVVRNLTWVLGRIRAVEAGPALEKLMGYGDPRVRREAVRACAATQGLAALPKLTQALSDPDEVVRLQSIAALGSIKDPATTEALTQFATRRNRSLAEMKEVLTSLRFQRTDQGLAYLKKTSQRRWPPTHRTRQISSFARDLLTRTGPEPVVPAASGSEFQ